MASFSLFLYIQYSTVQYSTVQYSTVQYSTVQYSTKQYSQVQYSTYVSTYVLYLAHSVASSQGQQRKKQCGILFRVFFRWFIYHYTVECTVDVIFD
jgi:hypothetical protein